MSAAPRLLAMCLDCGHPTAAIRLRPDVNGNKRYQRQCLDCGQSVGNFIAVAEVAKTVPRLELVPKWDDALAERLEGEQTLQRQHMREEWWEWYTGYLRSPEWRATAAQVHKRANNLCEGCRNAPSRHIHHLTYENVGKEFLWELVAVCVTCHERAHDKGPFR